MLRWLLVLVVLGVGCSDAPPIETPSSGAAPAAPRRARIVEAGGLPREVMNGLVLSNATTFTRLTLVPLSTEGLAGNAELQQLLAIEPFFYTFLEYMVECSLPEDRTVTVGTGTAAVELRGAVGLAPEWENGPCDEACQEWVSACLYSRTNTYGLPVRIYIGGEHPAFGEDEEDPVFNQQEGAFYGNFFRDQPLEYACRGSGYDPLYQAVRVCTQHGKGCGFTRVGTCFGTDGDTGQPSDRRACDRQSPSGVLGDCWSRATLPGQAEHPQPARQYSRVITIFTRGSLFAGGRAAAGHGRPEGPTLCGDPAPPPAPTDPEPDPGPQPAGTRCVTEDACDNEALVCDNVSPQPRCTNVCTDSARPGVEAAACGGEGSTCLAIGDGAAFCTRACDPVEVGTVPPNGCDSGAVCTRFWLYQSDTAAGCYNFCTSAADCGGAPCHARSGSCGAEVDNSLLADGFPCDPTLPSEQCRGSCLPVTSTVTEGICTSYINRRLRTRCPDAPSLIQPLAPGGPGREDDLMVCAYRACTTDADCPDRLRCRSDIVGGLRLCSF